MTKGTPSKSGGKLAHTTCRRCGKPSFHKQTNICSSCGFGRTSKRRVYNWVKRH